MNQQMLERPLPNDEASERAILGAIILTNSLIDEASSTLQPDDFYVPSNRRIFVAMLALADAGVEITAITVAHQLEASGIKQQDDLSYCSNLTYGVPHFLRIATYAAIIKEKSAQRRFMHLGAEIISRAEDGDAIGDMADFAERTAAEIRSRAGAQAGAFASFADVAIEAREQYERLHKGDSRAIPTGYVDLDRATRGGIQPGELWVIAALTGRGKSAWMIGAARQQAASGHPCAIVSREMSDFENFSRAHSAVSGVPAWRIKPGLWPDDYHALMETWASVGALPIFINSRTANVFEIRSQVKELRRNYGVRSVFVDYIQLMGATSDTRNATRAQEVATVSRVLKEIAMENEIGVFALAQFNRIASHDERPEIHHLAESSGIEKDASLVLILDMEPQKEPQRERNCDWRIAKHRNGPLLTLPHVYRGDTLEFRSREAA
jgi:replicative DNA helicase